MHCVLPVAYIGPVPAFGARAPFARPRSLHLPRLFRVFRRAVVEGECLGVLQDRSSLVGLLNVCGGV